MCLAQCRQSGMNGGPRTQCDARWKGQSHPKWILPTNSVSPDLVPFNLLSHGFLQLTLAPFNPPRVSLSYGSLFNPRLPSPRHVPNLILIISLPAGILESWSFEKKSSGRFIAREVILSPIAILLASKSNTTDATKFLLPNSAAPSTPITKRG